MHTLICHSLLLLILFMQADIVISFIDIKKQALSNIINMFCTYFTFILSEF